MSLQVREPRPGRLDAYRSDPDYQYATAQPPVGLWDRFVEWVRGLLPEEISRSSGRWIFWSLVAAAALLLAWAVYRILGLRPGTPLYASGPGAASAGPMAAEDFESTDFAVLMDEAAGRGDYRAAVRYGYLHALQILARTGQLTWRPGKTNHEYERDLRAAEAGSLADAFGDLTGHFEYAWYGELRVTTASFERVRASLAALLALAGGPKR